MNTIHIGHLQIRRWLFGCFLALAAPCAHPAGCNVSTVGLNFGNYDVFSTLDDDITGTIGVSCQASTSYSISLSSGSGTYSARTLLSAGNVLSYNLYLDPTRLTIWGDGSAATGTVSGTGITGSYTVYGRIPARQNAVVGVYADILTVTVAF
ncbi:MAG: spore Coat Protein domain protein [Gammaproteobacteria bacterium]|nr:spore Coat Protein domain protein [Gammaproteobacteria bacterium]